MDDCKNESRSQVDPLGYTPGTGSQPMSVLWQELPSELVDDILDKALPGRLDLHTVDVGTNLSGD